MDDFLEMKEQKEDFQHQAPPGDKEASIEKTLLEEKTSVQMEQKSSEEKCLEESTPSVVRQESEETDFYGTRKDTKVLHSPTTENVIIADIDTERLICISNVEETPLEIVRRFGNFLTYTRFFVMFGLY